MVRTWTQTLSRLAVRLTPLRLAVMLTAAAVTAVAVMLTVAAVTAVAVMLTAAVAVMLIPAAAGAMLTAAAAVMLTATAKQLLIAATEQVLLMITAEMGQQPKPCHKLLSLLSYLQSMIQLAVLIQLPLFPQKSILWLSLLLQQSMQ